MVTVLTAGHVNWDVTLRVDSLPEPDGEAVIRSRSQSGGGSAANVAVALAGLGISVDLVGSVGDDDNGLLARRDLERAGVDLDGLREVSGAETAVKYLLVDDDGAVSVLGNDGVNEAVVPSDVSTDRVRRADHVHLTSQRPETAGCIARIASRVGIPVSFDPGRRLGGRDYDEALDHADLVFATGREVERLLEIERVLADDTIVVVKHGADGAHVDTPEERYHHPGFDVDTVDTTGAGDAFAAGFIATWLEFDERTGRAYERALEVANACGALTARRNGARCAPESGQLRQFLDGRD